MKNETDKYAENKETSCLKKLKILFYFLSTVNDNLSVSQMAINRCERKGNILNVINGV